MSFLTHEQNGLVWLTSSLLDGVCHGFSTRQGGVSQPPFDTLNLAPGRDDDPAAVRENYRRFCGTLGVDPARTVLSKQVHEATVRLCTEADAGKGLLSPRDYAADALITRDANLPLAVFSADCGILLLYDPIHRAVGAIHAGWRGCAAGIPEKTVQAMTAAFGTRPEDLVAAVGPCIQQCCFETDGDVPAAMTQAPLIWPGRAPNGTWTSRASTGNGCCGQVSARNGSTVVRCAPPAARISSGLTARWGKPGARRSP